MKNNDVELIFGRLGRDPELKYTTSKEAVCSFSVAINKDKDSPPIWKQVSVWGELGERCSLFLKKGSQVFVRGQTKFKEYTSKKGELKSFEEMKAWEIGFINF
ncbi:single-stranded DNA-binding protein [Halobacteriovorax vibrionivorans]|uniref:Single-stranded DNA-binding protein n=1 Tax=Halobacteriovorax vibrionivorans TaxID=2152716 RepID=A0ABY0ICC5_9BACT|nr:MULTISPECIES: single-stranded DNA-binding protein [Halobacteriovorax]RZF20621.1 single-stranded DNA-binding protein [Halobacteriovorax vibrionivorans]TGD48968.1 single-stranded DNA-binding protein [Halobacteriovorax sp. Y22]